jgi:hypothetical protein
LLKRAIEAGLWRAAAAFVLLADHQATGSSGDRHHFAPDWKSAIFAKSRSDLSRSSDMIADRPFEMGNPMKLSVLRAILLGLLFSFGFAANPASAQATRTWVSGVGDDANPCNRIAPCKTFAGAISKTLANGEIDCLDAGGFGAVTITKAITIDCTGTLGSVLVSGTNAIIVSAGAADKVTLRGLSLNGIGTGLAGIRFLAGAQLNVERCAVFGFTGNGIDVNTTTSSNVNVTNTYITNVGKGIVATSTAFVAVTVNNTSILHPGTNGFEAQTNVAAMVTNSTITGAGTFAVVVSGHSQINIDSSTLFISNTAIGVTANGFIFVSNSNIYADTTNFSIAPGGAVFSSGNNRTSPGAVGAPSGSIPVQ